MAKVTIGGRDYEVEVKGNAVVVDGHEFPVSVRKDSGYDTVTVAGAAYRVKLPAEADRVSGMPIEVDHRPMAISWDGPFSTGPASAARREPRAIAAAPATQASVPGAVSSQIAGRVLSFRVKVGDSVEAGTVLLILEAMKMENEIKSAKAGTVSEILVAEGARVTEGQPLVVVS
jgi:biotin carboxyl carrier protein